MKQKSATSLKGICQKVIVIFSALLIIGNIFQFSPPSYILLIISIMTVFFAKSQVDVFLIKQYLFIVILVIYGVIVAVATGGGIGGVLTIVTGLMVCYASQEIAFDKTDIILLAVAMCISIVYWLYRSPNYYSEFFYNQWKGDGAYTNSNSVGHYLAYESSYMFMFMSLSRKKWIRRGKWILVAICIWGCYNVRARMALAALMVFIFINYVIDKFPKHREVIVKFFLLASVALEIAFPFIYLWMYKMEIGINVKMFGLSEKGLYSGRQRIWQAAFDSMTDIDQVLFGIGSKHDFWKGHILNMHNNAMNLFVIIGVVGLVLYFGYMINYIFKNFDFKNASKLQWQCLIFFICIVLEGTTDITLFYNSFLAYYFIPLGIALNSKYSSLKWRLTWEEEM